MNFSSIKIRIQILPFVLKANECFYLKLKYYAHKQIITTTATTTRIVNFLYFSMYNMNNIFLELKRKNSHQQNSSTVYHMWIESHHFAVTLEKSFDRRKKYIYSPFYNKRSEREIWPNRNVVNFGNVFFIIVVIVVVCVVVWRDYKYPSPCISIFFVFLLYFINTA